MSEGNKKSFLERLQSADDATKKRWMFISTAIIMAVVIYVWLMYFNSLIAGFSSQPTEQPATGIGFWDAVKNGTAAVYQGLIDKIRALGDILRAPREYIIKPPQ